MAQDHWEALIKSEQEAYLFKAGVKFKAEGDEYDLLYQKLNMRIDPSVRSVTGSVLSRFEAKQSSFNELAFDLDSRMTVDSVIRDGSIIPFDHSSDELRIAWPSIDSGTRGEVQVFYSGDPSVNEYKGFSYDNHMTGPISWTLSEPYGAYGWWPCKQQLYDKIDSFDMSIQVPDGNKAAGLGLLISVDTLQNNELVFNWEHRYPVVTYLVAVAVTNYDEFTHYVHFSPTDSMPILEYIYPEFMFIADTQALKVEDMILLFDSLCGPYPFKTEKYGHAQWGRGGGMEHQTMSFMSDLDFTLMAHELAHQWYGDKITCGSWQDIWLNEGFATYFTAIAYEYLRPRQEWEQYMMSHFTRATSENQGSVFVYDTTSVSRIFSGRLSYSKASYVLHMLRWEIGDVAFFEGIKNYSLSSELCYEFARTADLQWYLEQSYGQSLQDFFDRWVYKEGFPNLQIIWSRQAGNAVEFDVGQSSSHSSVSFFPLNIEFRLKGEGKDTTVVIQHRNNSEKIEIDPGFKVTEVEYDPNLWLLAKTTLLEGDHTDLSSVVVFPNPSNGQLEVYLKDKRIDQLEVFDRLGRSLIQSNPPSRKNESVLLNHDLSPGAYFLRVSVGEEQVVLPFMVH